MSDLQKDIYNQKYRWKGESFNNFLKRVSGDNPIIGNLIRQKKFIPGGRILAGRGTNGDGRKVTYSNCYVAKNPEDNLQSIFETAKEIALVFSRGGGEGLSLKNLRPRDAKVNNTAGSSTGAVSFADLYSLTTGLISQGKRRGALMLTLPVTHPDIEEFIDVKNDMDKVTNANISVGMTDDFMVAVKEKDLSFPHTFKVQSTGEYIEKLIDPLVLFRKLAKSNHNSAEPGILFWDTINNYHINDHVPNWEYDSVNPCGEKPLLDGTTCLLSSLNLSEYVINPFSEYAVFDIKALKEDVREVVTYMDDLLEEGLQYLPLDKHKEKTSQYRNLGIGCMGLADALIKLGIKYGDEESLRFVDEVFSVFANSALQQSAILAKERGTYPAYQREYVLQSNYLKTVATDETMELIEKYGLRNAELLSVAPTGTISTLLQTSGGIEPNFRFEYNRRTVTLNDKETIYKVYAKIVEDYKETTGDFEELPDYFVESQNIDYRKRIDFQARVQKYIDSAISSTVNLPEDTTVEEVEDLYMYAWEQKLKGVTIYRDNCQRQGILTTDSNKSTEDKIDSLRKELDREYSKLIDKGLCPECGGNMTHSNGCKTCDDCGYSPCSI